MKGLMIAVSALSVALAACQQDSSALESKLEQIDQKLAAIDQKLAAGARAGAAAPGAPQQARAQRPGPDASKTYSVPIAGAPYHGPEHAKVTIVKAFEFACPFCDRVRPTLDEITKKYGNDVKIVYKHLLVHPDTAMTPALATCAAHKQGKYEQMQELVWVKGFRAGRNLGQENMEKLAGEIGLDMAKFKADMAGSCKTVVQQDQAELRQVGAGGTPSFFINGRFLSGARPLEHFTAIIDEELKRANDALARGAKLETYYDEHVVKQGLKSLAQ